MRAAIVCVDFADLLALTLSYNRHHFSDVLVVTTHADAETQRVAAENRAQVFVTDSFYANGAKFNKWLALEQGLDSFGRHGWLTLLDADILWPKRITIDWKTRDEQGREILGLLNPAVSGACGYMPLYPGYLYSPLRRMLVDAPIRGIPPESEWHRLPIHRNVNEWAGYSQIFWGGDNVLGPPPWHAIDFAHAGTADSLFQARWPAERKVRPPFEVLHLGPAGENWAGRTTPLLDGSIPPDVEAKRAYLRSVWEGRRGKTGDERFAHEKITKQGE